MPAKIIQQLISGEYRSGGQLISVPIKSVLIDSGLANQAADLLKESGLSGKALVVSDASTNAVLGDKITAALGAVPLIFENGVKADIKNVERIKEVAKSADYIVAVGSGTINDLCKYASFQLNKPYAVFGTAPSMNGYGSANASISVSGHKKTLKAHLPQGIFLDLDILVKAPLRLIRSGFGDSVCRSTAQADWLLSHLLLATPYIEVPFEILSPFEVDLFANGSALVGGDTEVMRLLASTLVLSSFGMYIAGGSYPASQGEHMIAHAMEMVFGDKLPQSYHGEQIAVTTLTMAKLQEKILSAGLRPINPDVASSLKGFFGEELAVECLEEYKSKQFNQKRLAEINANISSNWNAITQKILEVIVPFDVVYKSIKSIGCPLAPEDIGWGEGVYQNTVRHAKYSRDRFTFLDLQSEF